MRYDIAMIMMKSMPGPSTSRSMKDLARTIAGLRERKGQRGRADTFVTVIA